MRPTREDPFIKLFLTAYEGGSWTDADFLKPDALNRTPAVDQIARRKSDGRLLAIEHTIIEPFVGEKDDLASFLEANFLAIEEDQSLLVPGKWIEVFVPVGTLKKRPPEVRLRIVQSVHEWLKTNRFILIEGTSQHSCVVSSDGSGSTPFAVLLTIRVVPLEQGASAKSGLLNVRRQQVDDTLGEVVDKALRKKVPKLANTPANKRILLLERQHMNPSPDNILSEIENRRDLFPDLARVDEIWIMETVFYRTAFGGTYVRFEHRTGTRLLGHFDFQDGILLARSEDGVTERFLS